MKIWRVVYGITLLVVLAVTLDCAATNVHAFYHDAVQGFRNVLSYVLPVQLVATLIFCNHRAPYSGRWAAKENQGLLFES